MKIKLRIEYLLIIFYSFIIKFFTSLASPMYPDFCFQADVIPSIGHGFANGSVNHSAVDFRKVAFGFHEVSGVFP